MTKKVILSAPSRLHFGMFSVGTDVETQYGGIGLMVEQPRTTIAVSASDNLTIQGSATDDCKKIISSWYTTLAPIIETSPKISGSLCSCDDLPIKIEVQSIPPRHSGLGSGTQLALCTVAAVMQYLDLPLLSPSELAIATGRGLRSAVGSYGFLQGGFLVDRGKSVNDSLAPLDFRTDFPESWPIVLVSQSACQGLSGLSEIDAFRDLPNSTPAQRDVMIGLVRDAIIPGLLDQNYDRFGEAVYEFGRQSGQLFSTIQGGPYNGALVTELVSAIRDFGVPAVGQTSWGPCVFAIARHDSEATELSDHLKKQFGDGFDIIITRADNQGVTNGLS